MNLKLMQGVKFLLLVIFSTSTGLSLFAQEIKSSKGVYSIKEARGNINIAREKAIENAFSTALSDTIRAKISEEVFVNNFENIEQYFIKNPGKYVEGYKIIKENKTDYFYEVIIEVSFNESLIYEDLAKSGLLKTLDYVPSITTVFSQKLIDQNNMKEFKHCFLNSLRTKNLRIAPVENDFDILIKIDLNSKNENTSSFQIFNYVKTEIHLEASIIKKNFDNIPISSFRTNFSGIYKSIIYGEKDNLVKACLIAGNDFINWTLKKYYKQAFGLKKMTIVLEGTFNVERAKDFMEELNKRKGYLKNPFISSITSEGIGISFTTGKIFNMVVNEIKAGNIGPFKTQINRIEGNKIYLSIY